MRRFVLSGLVAALMFGMPTGAAAADEKPQELRAWTYAQALMIVAPRWAISLMPGLRVEAHDSAGDAGGVVMWELFAGPVFFQRFGPVTLKIPLWYYYMGFPIREVDDYWDSHNLELIPIVEFRHGDWTFASRTIFHNKLFARNAVFTTTEQRRGYSLLIRQKLGASLRVSRRVQLTLADEVFLGVVEDGDTNDLKKGEPFFEKHGFSMNRVYFGAIIELAKGFSLSPQYIFETHHDPDDGSALTRIRHYFFLKFLAAFKVL